MVHSRGLTPGEGDTPPHRDGISRAFRYITASPDYTFLGRIEMGEASLVGELRATNYWGSVAAELFEGAAPFTAMGKLVQTFFAERYAAGSHA